MAHTSHGNSQAAPTPRANKSCHVADSAPFLADTVWRSHSFNDATNMNTKRNTHGDHWSPCVFCFVFIFVNIRRVVEAVAPPNHIGEKRRRTSDVTRFVRAGCRRCLRVAVADQRDRCASPDRLRTSRYASFHDIFIVSLSEIKTSTTCLSVLCKCNVC